jgi:hypothetical protein
MAASKRAAKYVAVHQILPLHIIAASHFEIAASQMQKTLRESFQL